MMSLHRPTSTSAAPTAVPPPSLSPLQEEVQNSPRPTLPAWRKRWGRTPTARRLFALLASAALSMGATTAWAEPSAQAEVPQKVQRLDVNKATLAQLCTLPGVGEKRAQAIIDFRNRRPFTRLSQLLLVRGIGKKTLRRLRPLLVVAPKRRRGRPVQPKQVSMHTAPQQNGG